jgi:hypothetical protein
MCARAGVGGRSGRGLLILLRSVSRSVPVLEPRGCGRRDSGSVGPLEGTRGGKGEITSLNSREYHKATSSSSSSSSGPSGKKDSRVNWKVCEGLASEIGRDGVDTAYGCAKMGGQATTLPGGGESTCHQKRRALLASRYLNRRICW